MRMMSGGPYFRLLSMSFVEIGAGFSVIEIDIEQKHLNTFGSVHGGAYASAIDTAAYWAAYSELPETSGLTTIDISTSILAPAKMGKHTVNGRSIKVGRTICLCEAEILDAEGRKIAHGTSKMLVTAGYQSISDAAAFSGIGELPPKFI